MERQQKTSILIMETSVENYTTATRNKNEHTREFTTRLKLLFDKAFPGTRPEHRDLQILSKMRGQLKDGKLNDLFLRSPPQNLNDFVNCMESWAGMRNTASMEQPKANLREE